MWAYPPQITDVILSVFNGISVLSLLTDNKFQLLGSVKGILNASKFNEAFSSLSFLSPLVPK